MRKLFERRAWDEEEAAKKAMEGGVREVLSFAVKSALNQTLVHMETFIEERSKKKSS